MQTKRLKALVLSGEPPYPPTHGGGRLKLYQLLKHLAPNHDLTLFTLLEKPEEREFLPALREFCPKIMCFARQPAERPPTFRERFRAPFYKLVYTEEMAAAIRHELQYSSYDLVHVETAHMAVYTELLGRHRKIIAAHDSQTRSYLSRLSIATTLKQRARIRFQLSLVRAFERKNYARYDAAVLVSDEDRKVINELCPRLFVQVVPNGIDLDYFRPLPMGSQEPDRLIFTGTMDFVPNVDAARWFVNEILPRVEQKRPGVCFEICGRNPTAEVQALGKPGRVEVTGFVPDLRPRLGKAAVYVCPVRIGTGMKNKMSEAMAMAKAIVTTSEGAGGLQGRDGQDYLVADKPDDFAAKVVALLEDSMQRRQMGEAARAFQEKNYSWERTGELMNEVYRRVGGLNEEQR